MPSEALLWINTDSIDGVEAGVWFEGTRTESREIASVSTTSRYTSTTDAASGSHSAEAGAVESQYKGASTQSAAHSKAPQQLAWSGARAAGAAVSICLAVEGGALQLTE